jgi:hypothetical protein
MPQKMTLNERVRQISRQLEASENHADFRLLRAVENLEVRLNSDGNSDSFLIPTSSENSQEIERLQGLYTMVNEYDVEGSGAQRFLRIRTSTEYRSVFSPFIAELMAKDLSNPSSALDETLQEWKNLWMGNSGALDGKQQRGLLGELIILRNLISNGAHRIIEKWVGPLGNTHDFESERINLEVKTTMQQPASVHISLIKQVAPMEGNKQLHLIVVGLENGIELNLNSEIIEIRNILKGTDFIGNFEHILRKSGYRDHHAPFYERMYSVIYTHCHQITKDSPVLDPRILGEIPSTVSNIKYTLDVHGMDMREVLNSDWEHFIGEMG